MRCVFLGQPTQAWSWKEDLAFAASHLGWDVARLPSWVSTDQVLAVGRGADLLMWARTPGQAPDGDVPGMLRRFHDAGTTTVGVHLDLYWGIGARERDIGRDPWWHCQYVFTPDGADRPWAEHRVNHRWLAPALGRRYLGRLPTTGRFHHRAVFTGTCRPGVHGPDREALLAWASHRYGPAFGRYGGLFPQVRGYDLADLYGSADVVLGDSAPVPGPYWSDRVPNVLGRGGLLTHPRVQGLAEQGYDDSVLVLYDRGDLTELAARLDALTSDERRQMTDQAIDLVADRHLWEHRLTQITQEVGLDSG